MASAEQKKYSIVTLYRRLLGHARQYWPHLAGTFGLSLLATPIALLTPLPLKIAFDSVLDHKPLPRFIAAVLPDSVAHSPAALMWVAALLVVIVAIIGVIQQTATKFLSTYAGEKLVTDFR